MHCTASDLFVCVCASLLPGTLSRTRCHTHFVVVSSRQPRAFFRAVEKGSSTAAKAEKGAGKLNTPDKVFSVRKTLITAGIKQAQAEALISFDSASISPPYDEISGVRRLLYGLYAAFFLVLLELTGKEDSVVAGLLQAGAKKFLNI